MNIKYWTNFSKRRNSTKQPTSGTTLTVNLKEGTSIEHPVFLLSGDLFMVNYVEAFGHYYFVDDVKSVRNGLTEISCSMDVLATFKTTIGAYNALIERSASFYDSSYADPLVSILNDPEVVDDVAYSPGLFSKTGCFCVSVLNDSGFGGTGFTTSYIMDRTNVVALSNYINTNWGSAAVDVVGWLQATFLKTANAIISCIWIPVSYDSVSGSEYMVRVGVDNISGCFGKPLSNTNIASSTANTITIPHHYSSGDFRQLPPYTQCKLFLPMYGCIDINPADFSGGTIKVGFYIDLTTGDCLAIITDSADEMVTSVRYGVGVNCPIGHLSSDVTGAISSGISTFRSAALFDQGGPLASIHAATAAVSAVNAVASIAGVTPSVSGSRGGRAMADHLAIHCITFAKLTQDPATLTAELGRPCMAKHAINTCSGYVKCVNASVDIPGMASEKDQVNDFLNNGFYYE